MQPRTTTQGRIRDTPFQAALSLKLISRKELAKRLAEILSKNFYDYRTSNAERQTLNV